ncbi:Cystathionine gamma-synthase [Lithohypha guttulata]|uniref:cystathionine gamma-synthase n=1 Tax=Lithohypha guttulata TaxID=1690604 RepID=A0AAN7Y980_9EURO|nr:Cystathionine gamma-synthase [Lithohypha guttulata]KAK5105131.1 Cystathionine gamma-synthase [Lithohypha guttulata]
MIAPVGQPVPDTPHAVSVSLPTWKANVGYEEGEDWVISAMQTGYPRFFVHLTIQELEREVLSQYGKEGERVTLFPSRRAARRCYDFFRDKRPELDGVRLLHLEPDDSKGKAVGPQNSSHHDLFSKGPKRYQRGASQHSFSYPDELPATNGAKTNGHAESQDFAQFVEERFGRNLNAQLATKAKLAVRRRIAGCLTTNVELEDGLEASNSDQKQEEQQLDVPEARLRNVSESDVYLYPTGMSSIFEAHQSAMAISQKRTGQRLRSICFGFPYIDTLKVLEKWGPGALFYGKGVEEDLDDLERRLESGERFASLFTEFPSNPLLRSPDLARIRQLADKYDFAVVIDETVGNYININVLPYADIIVSSLTKIFSGDSNVMGGSLVLNSKSNLYSDFKQQFDQQYEDDYWAVDAIFMERNSRDYIGRIIRINTNAEIMTNELQKSSLVKEVYYPALVPSRKYYDACKTTDGGYGGLFSVTFHNPEHAHQFFDNLQIQKGPSLGTNFTLSCPFVLIAHYNELDWARSMGVDPDLVRVSVGLEDAEELKRICRNALVDIQ